MAQRTKVCKSCGVPILFAKSHRWNADGTITQRRDPDHKMVFFDSDSLDELFSNIEGLIGMPIEKMVIESKARATMAYISKLLHGTRGLIARVIGLERIIRRIVEQGKVMGYGDIKVAEYSWEERYMKCEIGDPYCLSFFCGDLKGANEAIRMTSGTISYEEIGPNRYLVTNYQAPHAPELEERLYRNPPPRKPGDIRYDACPGCKVPIEVASFSWDLERGIITHKETGMRVAMFGPTGLQAIFDELEAELGEEIPATIVEAQRMHTVSHQGIPWMSDKPDVLRKWLAIQGAGNLVSLELIEAGFTARIENAALPLLIAGTSAGIFESQTGKKADVRWEIRDDGDLLITCTAAG